VARFLSGAWVEDFNRALSDVEVPAPASDAALAARDGRFSMCQIVSDGPDGDVRATLRVADGRVRMTLDDGDDADVAISLSWDDAVAMGTGSLAATDAIAAGRVRVRGDLAVLAEAQAVLAAVSPQLAALRASTGY